MPPEKFPAYVRGVRAIFAAHDTRCVIFGHAGDAHAHVNALVDVRAAGWHDTLSSILDEVTTLVAKLGGTIAAEHGDGRLRTPLLGQVWGPEPLGLFAAVKQSGWSGVFAIETDSKAFAEDPNRLVAEGKAFFASQLGRK